ncbi:glycine--tRNA ligase, chloroplastic/mitochondrial 2 isoform X2 [Ricinus communis]|uniref:glycine--tRNA ligase n=1 Tax=Ricinus communis TaxID=3988 RepID=B9RCZ0_RICCO|nr:glycine--tRNA ligase, chloroplastic/mitochondrial 2 isoform X2 [Ricinus communis]EEF50248.1 Glycyl-tRNA synthetase 2, chloroplast/mitochondrial precursor, putative [Ricinus communis]|eukprot:XP_002511579.1 glycine--tRNA ligase, chloroplastic/mitochondrial 2 isoform X2 [Ricinus communis]
MSILTLPLVISFLKPQTGCLSLFRLYAGRSNPSRLGLNRRHLTKTTVSAISTSAVQQHSSAGPNSEPHKASVPTFQQAIQRLQEYWASVGCAVMQCSNTEVGAGTMNPLTFLRVLGPEPWNVAYAEPSIRPDDSRYGENPNRLQRHTQFQVILKPDPGNSQDLFIRSLSALGIDVSEHDIRFVEDNWESPVLGAWGLGWEIWMDGMEITQFTYFQQAGSLQLSPISVEITYGLERILMLLQGVDHFKKIQYADGITYGELFLENEKEMSAYYLEHASVQHVQKHFDFFEEEARTLLASGLAIPAYDQLLKTSHAFNILDSRGFIGVTERARYFGRMRSLARQCAQLWLKTRESLGHPLGTVSETVHLASAEEVLDAAVKKVHDGPRSFVLEIGTEEMPPQDVVHASQQLKDLVVQLLEKQRLRHGEVQAFGTPRRLVVCVESLSAKQPEIEVEVRGPPVSKAFDEQGNPTKAAEGFCRRYNIPLDSLFRKADGKTEYIYARVTEAARLALEILSKDLPVAISRISFPKTMRWNSQVMFSRPIRWIMALHGDLVVPFIYAGVLSGNISYGLRNTPSATVEVENAESYASIMRNAGIHIEIEERKRSILEHSNALAKSVNGHIIIQENLLNEVVNLVEAPFPVLGKFKESFLELPKDLLTMVMQKHQKYFAVTDETGKLLPYFIAVANGAINEMVVRKGNEAVLRARYEDAKFFYEMDTRKKFSEFRSQLKGILFHEKLGTMLDKMTRIENMVTKLSALLGIREDLLQTVQDAASLAMSDLATAVVTEFTSLSGIMARHYALRDGYSEQVAEALLDITLPRFSGDVLPKTDVGILLAVADRLDSLIGLFAAGCQPSSTNDPFGLRRISYGLVQILVEKERNLDLAHALRLAADVQPIKVDAHLIDDAYQFVTRRLEQYLVDKEISPEIVRSVLAERATLPCLAARTAYKMETLSRGNLFPEVIEAYSRPTRIVRGKDVVSDIEVDEAAFETAEERALWSIFLSTKSKIFPDIEVDEFVEVSSELLQPLEDFFNNVFVMVEDERIRKNRLALLKKIADLPRGIADLSVLPGF